MRPDVAPPGHESVTGRFYAGRVIQRVADRGHPHRRSPPSRASAVAVLRRAGAVIGHRLRAPLDAVTDAPRSVPRDGIVRTVSDVLVAAVLYGVCVAEMLDVNDPGGPYAQAPVVLHLLAAATTLPVAVRRRRPAVAWLVTTLTLVVAWSSFTPGLIGPVPSGTPPRRCGGPDGRGAAALHLPARRERQRGDRRRCVGMVDDRARDRRRLPMDARRRPVGPWLAAWSWRESWATCL